MVAFIDARKDRFRVDLMCQPRKRGSVTDAPNPRPVSKTPGSDGAVTEILLALATP